MLDEIAEWLFSIEKVAHPFKRFVDFSQLTRVAIDTGHVFDFAQMRAKQFTGVKAVRTAIFSEDLIGFLIALLYASLMEKTPIQARAFRELEKAAEWLNVPVEVLGLKDKPMP